MSGGPECLLPKAALEPSPPSAISWGKLLAAETQQSLTVAPLSGRDMRSKRVFVAPLCFTGSAYPSSRLRWGCVFYMTG